MKRKKEKEEQTDPKTANDFLKEKAKTNESTEDESDSDNDTLPSEDDSDIESYATPKPSFFHQSPFTDPSVTPRSISSASSKMTEKEEQWKLTVQKRQKRSNISSPEGQNLGKFSKKN